MKTTHTILCGALAALSFSAPLEAWDSVGHQVVAHIAWENMNQQARDRAVELLKAAPPDADLASLSADGHVLFLLASTWPDIVRDSSKPERQKAYHRSSWHYTNFFWEPTPEGTRDRDDLKPARENVVERLEELKKRLADPARGDADKAVDLAWVLHLVGDVHQPLHTSARVTPTEPEGDRGGNLFRLAGDDTLHWYWDSILQKIWYRRGLGDSELAVKIAEDFQGRYPKSGLSGRLNLDFEAWAREGLATAQEKVYPPSLERGKEPSRSYRWEVTYATAKPAMALAGYRLAALLDGVLGASR
ncbi:MAG TPA: S1/P1 nuclease [Thermoanaerobaculia bacterium]|nr:S1/P1 nuclease [Thermoanaerobaculia bacterium]